MAYVNTTFLPKTNGLVFDPRLQARADKGRVFGLGPKLPPLAEIVNNLTSPVTVESTIRSTFTVVASGNYALSYTWQMRKADDSSWIKITQANFTSEYPDAVVTLLDVQGNVFNYTWVSGPSFPVIRCRISDTTPDGEVSTVNSTAVILNYS